MESYHEVVPAFLAPSKSLVADHPGIERHVIRLSAMRSGADLPIEFCGMRSRQSSVAMQARRALWATPT